MSESRARPVSTAAAEVAASTAVVAAAVAVQIKTGNEKLVSVICATTRPRNYYLGGGGRTKYPHLLGPHGQRG